MTTLLEVPTIFPGFKSTTETSVGQFSVIVECDDVSFAPGRSELLPEVVQPVVEQKIEAELRSLLACLRVEKGTTCLAETRTLEYDDSLLTVRVEIYLQVKASGRAVRRIVRGALSIILSYIDILTADGTDEDLRVGLSAMTMHAHPWSFSSDPANPCEAEASTGHVHGHGTCDGKEH